MPTISPQTTPYYGGGQVVNPANVIPTVGAPSNKAVHNGLGTLAVDNAGAGIYGLVSLVGGVATWAPMGGGSLVVSTLTGDSGGAISPSSGNINLLGTSNQITTTGSGHTITWSLPAAITAPGSLTTTTTLAAGTALSSGTTITAGTSITATLGAITATNGNVVLGTAGNKLNSTSVGSTTSAGANSFGTVALSSGAATVSTTAVTANSMIFISCQALGTVAAPKAMAVTAKTANTSFVITSADNTDTSTVAWHIVN